MTNPVRVLVTVLALVAASLVGMGVGVAGPGAQAASGPERRDDPTRTVTITGEGVTTWPAPDPAIERYAVSTTADTGGTLTVTATTTAPPATVTVNGRPAPGGAATLTGLTEGDEVAVWITDAAGTERRTYVYLPAGFPTLATTASGADRAPGQVMLGLAEIGAWFATDVTFYETVVDEHGVPSWVSARDRERSLDLKRQPDGHYTVARLAYPGTPSGDTFVELDEQFRPVRTRRTSSPLVHTDGHDLIVEPDGTSWLMAYEPNDETGMVDAVIQRLSPTGEVTFQWSSEGLEGETTAPGNPDYAHINSFDLVPGEDAIIASFRNLSAVLKIDTSTFDGSIEWKLGGRDSDFAIEDAEGNPDGGPCAQHTARLLPDGDVMMFDNGSGGLFASMCIDPADPDGPLVARPQTRILTLSLDEVDGVATIVRSYARPGRFAWFAGSAQPLPGGHTMVGWASATASGAHEIASELDESGALVWELSDPNPVQDERFFTYRAHQAVVPDAIAPVVTAPAALAAYVEGQAVPPPAFGCTDRGGSSLQTCSATAIDTRTPGTRSVRFAATDGAGNVTTVTRAYTVRAASLPAVDVRRPGRTSWADRVTAPARRAGAVVPLRVRIRNDGVRDDRLSYDVFGTSRRFRLVSPRTGLTPVLAPGRSVVVTVRVKRLRAARPGDRVALNVRGRSTTSGRSDIASIVVVARRR